MKLHFVKMHGAGNDFIVVDNREKHFPVQDTEWMNAIGKRHTGIGCDGFILIENSTCDAHFRMVFYNPDSSRASMCGNGARCAALFAYDQSIAGNIMQIETDAGILSAAVLADRDIKLTLPDITIQPPGHLTVNQQTRSCYSINTGVPHAVIFVDDITQTLVQSLGHDIRFHQAFAPEGTNVDFVQCQPPHTFHIRTYERGVEAETLACGTGIIASAITAVAARKLHTPVMAITAGGDQLRVDFDIADQTATRVTLTGPAAYTFFGYTNYPTL